MLSAGVLAAFSGCKKDNDAQGGTQYDAVDLGLSVKWASYNLGGSKPEDFGDYYAWGETETGKTDYSWETYKLCNGSATTLTKYNASDGKTTLDAGPDGDDVASKKWGGSWRMPTDAEWTELINNCEWKWETSNGVSGYRVTSKKDGYTDKSIFLPAAGYFDSDARSNVGSIGYYWSSSLDTDGGPSRASYLFFYKDDFDRQPTNRCTGLSVRPVTK